MGNCVTTGNYNRDVAKNGIVTEENVPPETGITKVCFGHDVREKKMKKKTVRFKLGEGDGGGEEEEVAGAPRSDNDADGGDKERRKGVVRIKVVMTQDELRQMLNDIKDMDDDNSSCSLEECLTNVMKLRGGRISHEVVNFEGVNSNWRPALESIPEDL